MDVSIIIVNWNSQAYVRQCLLSIFRNSSGFSFEIIVVDGASFDGCGEMLAREFPSVVFVQSETNVGFARANNLGVRHATGQYLLFLNPDTELLENSVKILLARLKSIPDAGAVGCQLLNRNRTIQTSCVQSFPTVLNQMLDSEYLRERFPESDLWGMSVLHVNWPRHTEVEVVSGACILARRDCFERVGGFTESYFMYGEDLDLCFKLRRSGARVYYVPETRVVHFGGGSTTKAASDFSTVMTRESVFRFMRLNRGLGSALIYRVSMMVTALLRLAVMGPMMLLGNRVVRHGAGSWRKWFAILRWSLGLNPLQRRQTTSAHLPVLASTRTS